MGVAELPRQCGCYFWLCSDATALPCGRAQRDEAGGSPGRRHAGNPRFGLVVRRRAAQPTSGTRLAGRGIAPWCRNGT